MDWDDAKYFLAIARNGQMLGAARALGVSQAMLSRRVAALEEACGTRLLHRSTQGCKLTDDGKIMFGAAERVEAEMLAAAAEMQGRAGISGTVRIGAPDGFGSAFLAPRLHLIKTAYPDLHLQLVPAPRSFSLSQREADVAVMIGRPERGRLQVRRLTDYSLSLYASRSYLQERPAPERVDDLRHHPLVGYVEDLIFNDELAYNADILKDWRSSIEVSTAIGQVEAVRGGGGIGLLHDFIAAGHDDLVRVLPDQRIVRTYWTAWHETMRGVRAMQAVTERLHDMVRGTPGLFVPD
ncbi:LysR family transcriptional regulator [Cereibacter sp. SYSU M97828]|nr:LysR family transcriptional regulator [Cereibacter flavus]